MFFYEGCSCPVCKKPFVDTDDIVTCPDCGAPHHRACWQIDKRCFHADTHGTPQQWSRETHSAHTTEAKTEENICGFCGAKNSIYAEFCSRCGRDLAAADWQSATRQYTQQTGKQQPYLSSGSLFQRDDCVSDTEEIDGVKAQDLRTFVVRNERYYLPRFRKLYNNRTVVSWNWAAFLLTPYWLWYRKQYLYGSIALLFELLASFCTAFFFEHWNITSTTTAAQLEMLFEQNMNNPVFIKWWIVVLLCSVVHLLICIFFGMVGNYLYFRVAKKRIQNAKKSGAHMLDIAQLGGTSMAFAAIAYAISYFASWFM